MTIRQGGAVAIFVKTPGYSPLKTRLAESIGKDRAEKFHQLSCESVASIMRSFQKELGKFPVETYWAVAEEKGLKSPLWQEFPRIYQGDGGLGERLGRIYEDLIQKHTWVIVVGGDSPQMPLDVLKEAHRHLTAPDRFVVGPAEDGGFYLCGGTSPIPIDIWKRVPYSDWQTGEVLSKELSQLGVLKHLPGLFDVDTVEELQRLKKLFLSRTQLSREQKALSSWLGEVIK